MRELKSIDVQLLSALPIATARAGDSDTRFGRIKAAALMALLRLKVYDVCGGGARDSISQTLMPRKAGVWPFAPETSMVLSCNHAMQHLLL